MSNYLLCIVDFVAGGMLLLAALDFRQVNNPAAVGSCILGLSVIWSAVLLWP
ncbi:MAG: hypothetical protein PHX53_00905 [Syntrophales bacterium]|nr:hypothetical protein [Syntrophales bacterium]